MNFHTVELFYIAIAAVVRARDDFERRHDLTDDALSAILLAAAAGEAFVNELAANIRMHDSAARDWSPISEAVRACASAIEEAEISREGIDAKFKHAARALDAGWRGAGALPFQDFVRLLKLRNAIVHLKPSMHDTTAAIVTELGQRIRLADDKLPWLNRVMTPEVAFWAVSTSRRVALEILALTPEHAIPEFDQLHWLKRSLRQFRGLDGVESVWPDHYPRTE